MKKQKQDPKQKAFLKEYSDLSKRIGFPTGPDGYVNVTNTWEPFMSWETATIFELETRDQVIDPMVAKALADGFVKSHDSTAMCDRIRTTISTSYKRRSSIVSDLVFVLDVEESFDTEGGTASKFVFMLHVESEHRR